MGAQTRPSPWPRGTGTFVSPLTNGVRFLRDVAQLPVSLSVNWGNKVSHLLVLEVMRLTGCACRMRPLQQNWNHRYGNRTLGNQNHSPAHLRTTSNSSEAPSDIANTSSNKVHGQICLQRIHHVFKNRNSSSEMS